MQNRIWGNYDEEYPPLGGGQMQRPYLSQGKYKQGKKGYQKLGSDGKGGNYGEMSQINPDHITYPSGVVQYHPKMKQWDYQEDWGNEGSSGDIPDKSLEWHKESMQDLSWAARIMQQGKDKDKGGIIKGQWRGEKNWRQDHYHNQKEAEDHSREAERIKDKKRIQQLEMLLEIPGGHRRSHEYNQIQSEQMHISVGDGGNRLKLERKTGAQVSLHTRRRIKRGG